tara:strand:+ start:974 stop:1159 length:186 start_codon:yes stop_codon:yes gene_type:complete
MDDSEKIQNLIEVMRQLKELEKIYATECDVLILSLMLALIHNTKIPDVTILPNNRNEIAIA